ncbi:MAG: T9SS type A sorting domain-containing protein [Ginsengibacter sp.]
MEKKFTFYSRAIAYSALMFGVLVISSLTTKIYAQGNCANSTIVFTESFGTGTTSTGSPDIITSALKYWPGGPLLNEATYRVSNSTQQKPEWHASEDGTPNDVNGKMLVINGTAGDFYSHRIDHPGGFPAGDYLANLFLMNLNTMGTCEGSILLANISLKVEYFSEANTWIPLSGSPISTGAVPLSINATWQTLGGTFNLPATGSFLVKSLRIVLSDATPSGCGNDFAIDEIKLSQCTEGGPLPVELSKVNARQKGSGISIEWSTSQEINSKYFVVEKSADGNNNWSIVSSVKAAGISSIVKNYNAFDARPSQGVNFYRLMQTDIDGNFKYSKTVSVRLNITKTGVTVIENPFHNSLVVDFSSAGSQVLAVRLADITGKLIASEKWIINGGNTRKDFSNVSRLQKGIYVLTISTEAGEILYNNKVIRQ